MLYSFYIRSFCCVLLCCLVRNKLIDWLIDLLASDRRKFVHKQKQLVSGLLSVEDEKVWVPRDSIPNNKCISIAPVLKIDGILYLYKRSVLEFEVWDVDG